MLSPMMARTHKNSVCGWMRSPDWPLFVTRTPLEVALAICRGNLHKYISELVSSGLSWLPMKVHLQERFSECGSVTMAKHKLTQMKHLELPMHEYIAKFGDMVVHVYSIKATNSASAILASNMAQKGHYTDCKNANITDSATDKVMDSLTRLFTDLVAQLKLLTPSGHDSHGGTSTYDGKGRNGQWQMGFHNGHRWHTNDSYHRREEPNQDCHIDSHCKEYFRHNGHQ